MNQKKKNNNNNNNINNNKIPKNSNKFTEKQQMTLNNLEKKLLQKLYFDLFTTLPETFKTNNLTFENFIFEFQSEIHSLYNFNSPSNQSYYTLLNNVSQIILKKYPLSPDLKNFSPLQLKKYYYDLKLNDDWTILNKYQNEIYKEEENKKLKEIANNMKQYYNDLKQQEIDKKKFEEEMKNKKKRIKKEIQNEENEKILKEKFKNDIKIKQLLANEKMMKLLNKKNIKKIIENEKLKDEFLNEIINDNNNLNKDNIDLVKIKLENAINIQNKQLMNFNLKFDYNNNFYNKNNLRNLSSNLDLNSDEISRIVDQIIKEKKNKNINHILNSHLDDQDKNYDNDEEFNNNNNNNNIYLNQLNPDKNNINDVNGIDLEIEKRVNEIMKEKLGNLNI